MPNGDCPQGVENKTRIDGLETTITNGFKEVKADQKKTYDKLFEDNGDKCLQSRVNENTQSVKLISWIFGGLFTGVLLPLTYHFIQGLF